MGKLPLEKCYLAMNRPSFQETPGICHPHGFLYSGIPYQSMSRNDPYTPRVGGIPESRKLWGGKEGTAGIGGQAPLKKKEPTNPKTAMPHFSPWKSSGHEKKGSFFRLSVGLFKFLYGVQAGHHENNGFTSPPPFTLQDCHHLHWVPRPIT